MKVLVINTVPFSINGISNVIMNLYRGTRESVCYEFIVNETIDDNYQRELLKNNSVFYILKRNKNIMGYIISLSKILKKGNYDIIHIHGNSALMSVELMACVLSGSKALRVVHGHNTSCTHNALHKILYPLFKGNYDYAIACSKTAGEWLYGKNPHIVLDNGIDEKRFVFDDKVRKNERLRNNISDNEKVILHVGVFNEQKNHTFLIDIFSELLKREPDALLRLVGTGRKLDEIKQKVHDYGIDDRVQFPGTTEYPENEYNLADVFVLPSLYESFGLVTVEAQCSGLPCVLSDNVPKDIMITDSVSFVSLESPIEEWVGQIVKYLNNASERKDNSESVIAHDYSISKSALKLAAFYESAIKKRG